MNRFRLLLLMVFTLLAILAAVYLPVEDIVVKLREWTAASPTQAMFGTCLFIVIGFLLMLPASLLMMLAGFLFGLAKGLTVTWVAGLMASTVAFWIGRTVARPWVERRIRRQSTFMAIDRAIQHKGFLVVLLTRIVMLLPFPALNYTLGLTGVRFRDYLAGSNIGMLPPYFLFVYLGTTVSNVASILDGSVSLERGEILFGTMALAAILLIVALIVRAAGRTLKSELAQTTDGQ